MPVVRREAFIADIVINPRGPVGNRLANTGLRIESEAKRLCPVDTGRLRSSISTTLPQVRGRNGLVVRVGSNVNYARFVELGTRFMRARPYLRPALEREVQ